jgi:hypothetical protein
LCYYVRRSASARRVGKSAILKAAFEGTLVPQDPNDEPASALLESIRAEREKEARPAGRRRRANEDTAPQRPLPFSAPEPVPVPAVPQFLDLPVAERIQLAWEVLAGLGALDRDEAVRRAAEALRDQGRAQFQRLRRNGALYEAIDKTITAGLRAGTFDRPHRGTVRAVSPDARNYDVTSWRRCLLAVLDGAPADITGTFHSAAAWAQENLGLQYTRLRRDGLIFEGLWAALLDAERRGEVERLGREQVRRKK